LCNLKATCVQSPCTCSDPKSRGNPYQQFHYNISKEYYDKVVPMIPLTKQEKKEFRTQKICHICVRSLDALPPLLEKKISITKKAIVHYTSLEDEKSVKKIHK
jgi:hypothetical protein